MIDPLLSLAFSMHSSPGAYALLLGSGISRSAGIPTGYEITLDLVRKVATLEGADPEPDPSAWYQKTHGELPNYSRVLGILAGTQVERNALLRSYFEPTEQEAAEGVKMPRPAHRAVAELMAAGYIRVVITTNFDRLLEKAAEAAGITPVVISTADAAHGTVPLVHAKATIIKVNGDYLDTRIKNTEEELCYYESAMAALLDRVLDDFGLLLCGWSAEWDIALRSAIAKASNRRFTTFWCLRGHATQAAETLMRNRQAVEIKIPDADSFLEQLKEKIFSLRELSSEHPLSNKLAVQTIKRYLPNPQDAIRLNDLVMQETERVYAACAQKDFPFDVALSAEDFRMRAAKYEAITGTLMSLFSTGCYWGTRDHIVLWVRSLQRIANPAPPGGGRFYQTLWRMSHYPSLLLLYAGGIAAVAAKKYETFAALSWQPVVRQSWRKQDMPLVTLVNGGSLLDGGVAQNFNPGQTLKTPTSIHLYDVIRPRFSELLPDDVEFQRTFDEFEYLIALSVLHRTRSDLMPALVSFAWREPFNPNSVVDQVAKDAERLGSDWPPLKAGLFGGSLEAFKAAREALHSSEIFKHLAF